MLMSSSTDVYSGLGGIATTTLSGVMYYIFIVIGVILGLYILERLITAINPRYKMDRDALSEGFELSYEEEEEEEGGDPPKGTEDYEIAKEEGDLSWQRR